MQRLYRYLKLSSCIIQLFTCIPIHTKINILEICWVSKETLMHNSNAIISHCICHSIVKILYIGKGKEGLRQNWNWRTKMNSTMYYHHAHWTVCMYVFIACYYELLMLIYMNCDIYVCWFYMNCNIDICVTVWTFMNELWKYMCDIFDKQTSFMFCVQVQ